MGIPESTEIYKVASRLTKSKNPIDIAVNLKK
jgi:hypothetical protein